MPLLLDPKLILDYIDLWHKDPNTPMPDFKLTPGQSHMLTHFISEEKWKYEKARQLKKAQYRKEKFLKNNVVSMTTDELVKLQSVIKVLSDDFNAYYADWKGAKARFVNLTKTFTSSAAAPVHIEVTPAEASAQQTEEHASTADDNQAAEDNVSSRAPTCGAPEENEEVRATASVVPEETAPNSSAPPARTPTPIFHLHQM